MFLRDFVKRCSHAFPEKAAFVHRENRRTWREMHERSERLASALHALGMRKGDATAILSHNRIELAEHWFACLKGGTVRAGVNWRYSQREMLHAIRDCNARVILIEDSCVKFLAEFIDELKAEGRVFVGIGKEHGMEYDYESLLAKASDSFDYPALSDSDVAMLGYTSGTTGLPKGVILTQRNVRESVVHNVIANGYQHHDVRAYVTNPAGINIFQMCFNIATGMTTVLDDYETQRFLNMVEEHKITTVTIVPTMLRRILDELRTGHYNVSSLRQICYGTMPSTPALIRSAYDALGCTFMQRYGVSESSGGVAALRDEDHRLALNGEPELLTSIGKALLHADISIRDDDGQPVAPGELGTVWIKSDTIMTGYLNLPQETAEALALPWLRTGDYGRMDERGYIFLGDRKKHMIISGGMNIYPVTIENALAEHPAVRESIVVGIPHPEWGEAVAAAVSLVPGAKATTEELIAHCRGRVPKWEVPKHLEIFDDLPTGNTDKLNKLQIKEALSSSSQLPWLATA
jgi:acyl-CoA synthetase (AMP-forming)/AMP-acid ligase II